MREHDIEAYLVHRATLLGGEVRKVKWIGRRGAPDRVVFLPGGKTLWVELKRPGQKANPHQAREHARMRDIGQAVVVVDSLDEIEELLK
jgi:hypothetical protein